MPGPLKVAEAGPEAARAAAERILPGLPEWFGRPAATAAYIDGAGERLTLLAREGEDAVGLVSLQPHFEDTAEIWLLAVHRPHHRRGIGARLIAAAEGVARRQGRRWLMLNTVGPETDDTPYAATRAFYAAQGFRPVLDAGTEGRGVQMIWMLRALEELTP